MAFNCVWIGSNTNTDWCHTFGSDMFKESLTLLHNPHTTKVRFCCSAGFCVNTAIILTTGIPLVLNLTCNIWSCETDSIRWSSQQLKKWEAGELVIHKTSEKSGHNSYNSAMFNVEKHTHTKNLISNSWSLFSIQTVKNIQPSPKFVYASFDVPHSWHTAIHIHSLWWSGLCRTAAR